MPGVGFFMAVLPARVARFLEAKRLGRAGTTAPRGARPVLRHGQRRDAEQTPGGVVTASEHERAPRRAVRWVCLACEVPLASPEDALAVGGASRHERTNPWGVSFEFVTVRACQNVAAVGDAVRLYSFFPGHAWQVLCCAACGMHLGWRYSGGAAAAPFFALLLNRIRERED
jgi:hypothetical protein